ncbi:hypothetical protein OAI26_07190 [Sulfitobacter sp.]|nr:hypothetical protein [Sulfitobacter sp.]
MKTEAKVRFPPFYPVTMWSAKGATVFKVYSYLGEVVFGRGGAHRSEVADVAIVAVAGRRISFFQFTLTPARAAA